MNILVNGASHEVTACDLASMLKELGYAERAVATALNGEFIPHGSRSNTLLTDGDRVEVVSPMQGG